MRKTKTRTPTRTDLKSCGDKTAQVGDETSHVAEKTFSVDRNPHHPPTQHTRHNFDLLKSRDMRFEQRHEPFDSVPFYEDFDLWVRMADQGATFHVSARPLVMYDLLHEK
jgi:hypothetical protein